MKSFKKSALSMAMTTALLAGGLLATHQASAYEQALPTPNGTDALPYVSSNGMGQALIYPHYTVRGGFQTTFNVFNTSDTHAVAVKVRFREYQNSRDVLDFNLVLSPNDKWSGNVKEHATFGAMLTTGDSSCTVPAIGSGAPFSTAGYTLETSETNDTLDFKDSGTQDVERLKHGYIEVISMAWSEVDTDSRTTAEIAAGDPLENVYLAALHAQPSGVPADCAVVRSSFVAGNTWTHGDVVVGSGTPWIEAQDEDASGTADWTAIPDGANPLFGELALINADGGVAGGTNAVALADWMQAGTPLLTAQAFPFYLEPSLATANGLWDTARLQETDNALMATTVINEWANNPNNGAAVTWAVTMPTKSFHVDQDFAGLVDATMLAAGAGVTELGNIQAGSSDYRFDMTTGNATLIAPFERRFAAGVSESTINLNGQYGSEEGEVIGDTGEVSFSPGSFTTTLPTFKYEANTISFAGESAGDTVLNSADPLTLDPVTDVRGGKFSGHLRLTANGAPAANRPLATNKYNIGLPMIGFAMKTRDTGNSSLSFGQILDHKWMQMGNRP